MTTKLNPRKIGIRVSCQICGRAKQPVGRSAPMQSDFCDFECYGYSLLPNIGSLWPGESEADFGFHVADTATEIIKEQS